MKGIYKITQKSTGKVYIGQSIHIDNRWNEHAQAIDNLSFHQEYKCNPIDFTFEVLSQNDDYTKDDLDRLEKQFITDYKANDPKYGFNGTSGNGDGKRKTKQTKILPVKMKIIQHVFNLYVENQIKNKKVLIIGIFNTIPEYLILKGCDVTILTDDYDYTCECAKIIRFDGGDELMGKVKDIKKDEFDLIIANPPYNIGNKIVNTVVDKAKECIVLMPISCYKHKELYQHVRELQRVDPKTFKDADITANLCVCKLIDWKDPSKEFFDISSLTYDENYRPFYRKNFKIKDTFNYISVAHIKDKSKAPDVFGSFMLTVRTILDGTHRLDGDAADIDWNIRSITTNIPWDIKANAASCAWLYFPENSNKCKQNLIRFWYYNPLMNKLLKGLNSASGRATVAIPHIDWSKDRDYEHCTLDDIMMWLDEDNK